MPAEERSIRDRLAEALWRYGFPDMKDKPWSVISAGTKNDYSHRAGRLLKAFATVGLVLTKEEDTTPTRQVQGGGETDPIRNSTETD